MRLPEVVLKDAAAYIEEHGWCQGTIATADGRVCIVQSILQAANPPEFDSAFALLAHRLGIRRYGCASKAGNWNDAPGRTKAEVLAVLRGE